MMKPTRLRCVAAAALLLLADIAVAGSAIVMPPTTNFYVNGKGLMRARFGHNTLRIRAASASYATGTAGEFRIICNTSHMEFGDPIVYPATSDFRSHLHTFFGNSDVHGSTSTANLANLAAFGRSSCDGGTANNSAYWVPALIDTSTGLPVMPRQNLVYYKNSLHYGASPALRAQVTAPVTGLRMIAGDPSASSAQPGTVIRWDCIAADGTPYTADSIDATIKACAVGLDVQMRVFFPECWDGVNLDSPSHGVGTVGGVPGHMAYENVTTGCPSTHPVVLPTISYNIRYRVKVAGQAANWRLSADRYSTSISAGFGSHGDYVMGWQPAVLQGIVTNCLHNGYDCHANLLGDGTELY